MALSAFTFTGCGETGGPTQDETKETAQESAKESVEEASKEEPEEASKEAAAEVTEITWWSGETGSKSFWDEKVEEFNQTIGKENGVKLVVDYTIDATALEIALQNGEAADIISAGDLRKRVESGYFISLDDIPELADLVAEYDVRIEDTNAIDGKTYVLPLYSTCFGLAYNKEMFVEAGIVDENGEAKAPATFDEMLEAARLLTNVEEQKFGLILPGKWGAWPGCEIEPCAMSVNGYREWNPAAGEFDFSGYVPVMEMLMTMKEEGLLYPGTEGLDNDPARARFAEGNVGMKFCVTWDVAVWNDQFPAKFDWGIAPLPVVDEKTAHKQVKQYGFTWAISKARAEEAGRAEKIAVVYNWICSDELMADAYEQCVYFPSNPNVIAMADTSKMTKKGMADFGEVITQSAIAPSRWPVDLNGGDSWGTTFVNEVWSGQKTPAEWAEDTTAQYNEGMKYYKELHPNEDYSDRIDENWTPEAR